MAEEKHKAIRGADPVSMAVETALEELLTQEQVPFRQITATMLCRKAGISRQTYYRHFAGADEVLDALARRAARYMAERAAEQAEVMVQPGTRATFLFERFDERIELLRALKRADMLSRFLTTFWHSYNPSWLAMNIPMDESKKVWLARFTAGSISGVVEDWVDEDKHLPADEMGALMGELFTLAPQLTVFTQPIDPEGML